MASALSGGGMHPRLSSAPAGEEIPAPGKILTFPSGATPVNPVVETPPPLSRGAVVQVETVRETPADSLGAQTTQHLNDLRRHDGAPRMFFGRAGQPIEVRAFAEADVRAFSQASAGDPHQYRLLLSAPDAGRTLFTAVTRDFMARIERETGRSLDWLATVHHGAGMVHAHVVVRGRDQQGQVLLLSQQYQQQGLRMSLQQAMTSALGELPVVTHRVRQAAQDSWHAVVDEPASRVQDWMGQQRLHLQQFMRQLPALTERQAVRREQAHTAAIDRMMARHAGERRRAASQVHGVEGPVAEALTRQRAQVVQRLSQASQQLLQRPRASVEPTSRPRDTSRSAGMGR